MFKTTLFRVSSLLSLCALALCATACGDSSTNARGDAPQLGSDQALKKQLVEKYKPVLFLREQDDDCGPGEPFDPGPVDMVLGQPNVFLRTRGEPRGGTERPTVANLVDAGEDTYLDWPGDPREPGCDYEERYNGLRGTNSPLIYARIATEPGFTGFAVQYWFFYYYNDFTNKHEGDWEFIQLRFQAGSLEEALRLGPAGVAYSAHSGGEKATWPSGKLTEENGRPFVYVAEGSHANYFQPAEYWGVFVGGTVAGCDNSKGPHRRMDDLDVVLLPDSLTNPPAEFAWLNYEGLWGELGSSQFSGIKGPPFSGTKWLAPFSWESKLRDSSEQLTAHITSGVDLASAACLGAGAFEWGAGVFHRSPGLVIGVPVTILLLGLVVFVLGMPKPGSPDYEQGPVLPKRRRKIAPMTREMFRLYWRNPYLFFRLGLATLAVALPALAASLLIGKVENIFDNRLAESALLLAVALLQTALSLIIIESVVTVVLKRFFERKDAGVWDSLQSAAGLLPQVIMSRLWASAIVIGLGITIVRLRTAVRRSVSWLLIEQAILIDGRDAPGARERSAELIEGHGLRAFGYICLFAFVLLVPGILIEAGMPLFLAPPFSEGANLVNGVLYGFVLAPLVMILKVMLYYDFVKWPQEDHGRVTDALRWIASWSVSLPPLPGRLRPRPRVPVATPDG